MIGQFLPDLTGEDHTEPTLRGRLGLIIVVHWRCGWGTGRGDSPPSSMAGGS